MSDKCNTLFVFEGEATEGNIVSKLEKHFMGESIAIKCAFCGNIYQFYSQLKAEEFSVEMLAMLKQHSEKNRKAFADYDNDSFAYIYFFFDYDGHATEADDEQVAEMLDFFNNETENGKLFVSYPMVEAIRHYKDKESFKDLVVKCKRANCPNIANCKYAKECLDEPRYKTFVPADSNLTITKLDTPEKWKELIDAHLCKGNFVVNNDYSRPDALLKQSDLFQSQQQKYISQFCPVVAVLSAFPLFIQDYYGVDRLNEKLDGFK